MKLIKIISDTALVFKELYPELDELIIDTDLDFMGIEDDKKREPYINYMKTILASMPDDINIDLIRADLRENNYTKVLGLPVHLELDGNRIIIDLEALGRQCNLYYQKIFVFLAEQEELPTPANPADILLLFGNDDIRTIEEAAKIYREGRVKNIVVSGFKGSLTDDLIRHAQEAGYVLDGASEAAIRCLFPEPPPPGLVPSCQEAGILGAVAGVIGTIQANEVLKYVLGIGELLIGKLLVFNALDSFFRQVKVPRDPKCPVCGANPSITKLIDYEQFCQIRKKEA